MKMIKGLKSLLCEEGLKDLYVFTPGEGLITVFKYAVGVYKAGRGSLVTRRYMEKRMGNGLPRERFLLDITYLCF